MTDTREKIIEVMKGPETDFANDRRMKLALTALEAAGYRFAGPDEVVVPREHNGNMDEAGATACKWWEKAIASGEVPRRSLWGTIWNAMIAASQEPRE